MTDTGTHTFTLTEALDAQRAKTPADAVETITSANRELAAQGAPPGLEVGETAPDFTLPNATGEDVTLSQSLADGASVVTFYRGGWCPYCNLAIRALQDALPAIQAAGASLMAISPQRPDDALTLQEKHALTFDVLSDVDQSVIADWRVQYRVPAEIERVHMETFKKDISKVNADGSWNLPLPATFVLDRDGVVRARHVDPEYTRRMEPSAIVAALKALEM